MSFFAEKAGGIMRKSRKYGRLAAMALALILLVQMSTHAAGNTDSKINDVQDSIDDLTQQQEEQQQVLDELNGYKAQLSAEAAQLNEQLQSISDSLTLLQEQIDEKTAAIADAQTQIDSLTQQADALYEAMKKRIQYTYENGSTSYVDALFQAESFADLMNRVEYVKAIHDYDREQLEVYQTTVAAILEEQQAMETAKAELEAAQEEAELQKQSAELLLAAQQEKIVAANSDITSAQADLDATNDELARQKAYEEELERQKAQEDAKRQDEIKQQEEQLPDAPAISTSEGDLALMAAIIQCEAGGESYEGKLAVGSVVMNRVASSYFPNTVMGVIYQKGQFSPVASGRFATVLEKGADDSCVQAAAEVLGGKRTINCLYFRRNNGTIDGTVIGNHVFY